MESQLAQNSTTAISDSELPPHVRYVAKLSIGSSHTWALETAGALTTNSRILDIGAGSGIMGRLLAERGFKDIAAVEIDDSSRAAIATTYTKTGASLSDFKGEAFDLLLLLDILEHTPEPERFLQEALTLLAPGGKILISVPNIVHWTIRLCVIFGFFPYAERGLLDKTHLQFFTRKRAKKLSQISQGLELVSCSSSISPLELLLPKAISRSAFFKLFSKLRLAVANIYPGPFAYQHLIVLKRS